MANEETTTEQAPPAVSSKLPKAVYFILGHNFLSAFGIVFIGSISTIFIRNRLGFTENEIVSITHMAAMITFFLSPIGALIVDSFGNQYILLMTRMTISGVLQTTVLITAFPQFRYLGRPLLYMRLAISVLASIVVGSAFAPFEGNQFKLPDQQAALVKFYQIDYIIGSIATLSGFIIAPTLRTEVACMGEQDCYILGFGLGTLFGIISIFVFAVGHRYYIIRKPERNMAFDIFKCIGNGFRLWIRERKTNPKPHWLDHAEPAYGVQLVDDIKRVFRIVIIFSIIPLYFAVYSQISAKWLFQNSRLNGRVGSYTIITEHLMLLHPILGLIMMPLIMKFLDPFILRWKMDRIFRRMILGGTMIGIAFLCAAFLESEIIRNNPVLPEINEAQLRIFNGLDCSCIIKSTKFLNHTIEVNAQGVYTNKHIPIEGIQQFKISIGGSCIEPADEEMYLEGGQSISVLIKNVNKKPEISTRVELVEKTMTGLPILTAIGADAEDSLILEDSKHVEIPMFAVGDSKGNSSSHRLAVVVPQSYKLFLNGRDILDFKMHLGGLYVVMISGDSATLFTITEPNSVHVVWVIPQTIILVFGDVYFGIALAEFTYSEAPRSLKVLTFALRTFAAGLGDFVVILITMFGNMRQDHEFYFYAFLVFLDMAYLVFVALRFKSINPEKKLI